MVEVAGGGVADGSLESPSTLLVGLGDRTAGLGQGTKCTAGACKETSFMAVVTGGGDDQWGLVGRGC